MDLAVESHIEDEVTLAKRGDRQRRELLLVKHRQFIHAAASRVARRHLDWANDDELSVAMLAFNEAIDRYDETRSGSFLALARVVIERRLVDYFRRQGRGAVIPLSSYSEEELHIIEAEAASTTYERTAHQSDLSEEVSEFKVLLNQYGIKLADLVKSSPRHRDSRATLARVARTLASTPPFLDYLRKHRQLPLRELELATRVSRRQLENGRRYIVALALILSSPELVALKDFTPSLLGEGGMEA